jgi:hypothetical protein
MIKFKCTKCGEGLEAPESLVGQAVKCPKCELHEEVPGKRKKRKKYVIPCLVIFLVFVGFFAGRISIKSKVSKLEKRQGVLENKYLDELTANLRLSGENNQLRNRNRYLEGKPKFNATSVKSPTRELSRIEQSPLTFKIIKTEYEPSTKWFTVKVKIENCSFRHIKSASVSCVLHGEKGAELDFSKDTVFYEHEGGLTSGNSTFYTWTFFSTVNYGLIKNISFHVESLKY